MIEASGLLVIALGGVFFASMALWVWIAVRSRSGPILAYQQRRPVPWNAAVGLIALLLTMMALAAAAAPQPLADEVQESLPAESDYAQLMVTNSSAQLVLVAVGVACLAAGVGARRHDFGLPASAAQLRGDLVLGIFAALAVMAPAYGLNILLVTLLDWPAMHPTLERIATNPSMSIIAASFLAAAIAAPIFEEFVFRLLFQGWLEKLEDEQLPWPELEDSPSGVTDDQSTESQPPREVLEFTQLKDEENPYVSSRTTPLKGEAAPQRAAIDETTRRSFISLGGLPHGWPPILASSALFAVAHVGQGPAPLPLFVFALVQGYLYQRTHRILPCIIAHMAFNSFSLLLMILGARLGSQ